MNLLGHAANKIRLIYQFSLEIQVLNIRENEPCTFLVTLNWTFINLLNQYQNAKNHTHSPFHSSKLAKQSTPQSAGHIYFRPNPNFYLSKICISMQKIQLAKLTILQYEWSRPYSIPIHPKTIKLIFFFDKKNQVNSIWR